MSPRPIRDERAIADSQSCVRTAVDRRERQEHNGGVCGQAVKQLKRANVVIVCFILGISVVNARQLSSAAAWGVVKGQVRCSPGATISGDVSIQHVHLATDRQAARLNADGRYAFQGLWPGEHVLKIAAMCVWHRETFSFDEEAEILLGQGATVERNSTFSYPRATEERLARLLSVVGSGAAIAITVVLLLIRRWFGNRRKPEDEIFLPRMVSACCLVVSMPLLALGETPRWLDDRPLVSLVPLLALVVVGCANFVHGRWLDNSSQRLSYWVNLRPSTGHCMLGLLQAGGGIVMVIGRILALAGVLGTA